MGPQNHVSSSAGTQQALRAGRTRLLFADDNPAMLHQVSAVLEDRFDIVAALSSGEAVLSKYAALTPDVIILDISMGGMSGLDVAKTLREQGCRLPIVFLTVHTGTDFVSAALACGGSGYVVKSHMKSDLVAAIMAAKAGKLFVSLSAR